MILKIPVEVGEHVVTGLFNRDSITLCLPWADAAKSHIYVNNISTPLVARVRHALLSEFLGRAHGSSEGTMDATKLIDREAKDQEGTVVDSPTGERAPKMLHFRNNETRVKLGDVIGHNARKYKIVKVWNAGQDLFNYDAELLQ